MDKSLVRNGHPESSRTTFVSKGILDKAFIKKEVEDIRQKINENRTKVKEAFVYHYCIYIRSKLKKLLS